MEHVLQAATLSLRVAVIERYLLQFLLKFQKDEARMDRAI